MPEGMIEFREITKHYGSLVANDRLSLTIRRGELMTLLGPSGCGKTTALRCLTGYIRPDEGRILIDGKEADTIAGHVDIRHPLQKSLKWVKSSKEGT